MSPGIDDFPTGGENRYLSTAQVARALGVSVTTVKRWVDDNVLPAHRTVGGHRKLLLADVLRLVREGNLPQADLSCLVDKVPPPVLSDPTSVSEQLYRAFLAGDQEMVRSLIHGSYQGGLSVETLGDRVIAPALARLGHEWAIGRLDVLHEHRSTQACISALYELKSVLRTRAEKNRPVAVGGAPEGDHYLLPTLLVKMSLLDAGWDAINLGPHTPIRAFRSALKELHPEIVWVSVTHLENADRFLAEYKSFYEEAEEQGVAVIVGGRGLSESVRSRMPYTSFGDGITHLVAFAKTLHRLPSRPKRGRPPGTSKADERALADPSSLADNDLYDAQ